ncbi:phage tail sheath family protein [Paenibacillus glufosinatiresistens]|uniref:phage tail sheath family protein n=1 Tax=Paenibacillus glufosinatiresistens TaxID=3070657 RepID=UPI00286E97B5|nr:phage tail sheath family protein [Paenibacillus sp. YX.27]
MAYQHGIYVNEQATSVLAPNEAASGIPFVVGTAPVHLADKAAPAGTPVLAYTYADAVAALGYSDDWSKYTLCEAMYTHFVLYQKSPMVLVNVLDPAVHKTVAAPAAVPVSNRVAKLAADGVLLSSLTVKSADGNTTYVKGTDYTASFDDKGKVVITTKAGGAIAAGAVSLQVGYTALNPSAVDADDVIGGVSASGEYSGFELVHQVFPRFGVLPDLLMAPGWSHQPAVAAVMAAKASNINGNFKAIALTDLDPAVDYTAAGEWKSSHAYTGAQQIVTYPKVTMGGRTYWLSSHLAGRIATTDSQSDGIPFVSPSNKNLSIDGAVLAGGKPLYLGLDQAAYLNSQGIVTAFNLGTGGWKAWGSQTGAYPAGTDPKDVSIPVRRMFNWVSNSLIMTYLQKVDDPMNKRLTQAITDSLNIWLNGLTAAGALLGGRVEFRAAENPSEALMAGKVQFHLFLTPPTAAQEIDFVLEYDSSYLSALTA